MSRLGELDWSRLSDPQQQLLDAMTGGPRGKSAARGGPFEVWLHSPEFGARAQAFGAYVRYETSVAPRHLELAVLLCAQRWQAAYEWWAHAPIALSAGVPARIVDAIRDGRRPEPLEAADEAVLDLVAALLKDGQVSDTVYNQALSHLGRSALVELVGIVGYYTMVAFTLNTFRVEPPSAAEA